MRTLPALALAGLLFATAAAQAPKPQNLAVNGGFDQGADPGGYKTFKKGDKFPGWTITKGSIDQIGSYFKCAHKWCVDMDGNEPGGIRQSIATEAGKKYEVAFLLSANPQCGEPKKTLRVAAVGDSKLFAVTPKNPMAWARQTWQFTAQEDKTALSFDSLDKSGACGPLLDSVVVTLVPEPPPDAAPTGEKPK